MDETRVRAIIREEIVLAVKALDDAADWTEADEGALTAIRRTAMTFGDHYRFVCRRADEQRAEDAADPFTEDSPEAERRRVTHAAAYLPAVDLNAFPAGAYKLLGNLTRNDAYTNAVIRLMQHGGPRTHR